MSERKKMDLTLNVVPGGAKIGLGVSLYQNLRHGHIKLSSLELLGKNWKNVIKEKVVD